MKRKIDRRCRQLKKEVLGPCKCDEGRAAKSIEVANNVGERRYD